MVVKNQLLESHPWPAEDLSNLFKAGKDQCPQRLHTAGNLDPAAQGLHGIKGVIAAALIPFGVEPNRKTLEPFMKFDVQQEFVPRPFHLEEIFPPSLITAL